MKKNNKVLKLIIASVIIIILILLILILILAKGTKKTSGESNSKGEQEVVKTVETIETNYVDSPTMFYTVQNALQKYLTYAHLDYTKYKKEVESDEEKPMAVVYNISNINEKKKAIIKFLTAEYLQKNKINEENIDKFIQIDNDEVEKVKVSSMKQLETNQFYIYGAEVEITTKSGKAIKEYYRITLDEYNSTYMLEPLKTNNIDEIELKEVQDIDKIEDKEVNRYSYIRVNDAQMATNYYQEFKTLMLKNPTEAYSKLSKEYREKRFGTLEHFIEFIKENRNEINGSHISQYLIEEFDGGKKYVCKNESENIYTFKAKGIAEYEVELDTYTLASDKFKEEYNKGDDYMKVKLNLDKFRLMINNQDYRNAANLLNETFKKNQFKNQNEFNEYIKTHMYRYNKIVFNEIQKEGQVYICKATFTDLTNGQYYSNKKQKMPEEYKWTFMVKLIDENSFEMSFTK